MSDWNGFDPITARFEILRQDGKTVVLQVDENGLPYTPPPALGFDGKPLNFTCDSMTLTLHKGIPDTENQP